MNVASWMLWVTVMASVPVEPSIVGNPPTSQPADATVHGRDEPVAGVLDKPTYTARYTSSMLKSLIQNRGETLPIWFQLDTEREAYLDAVDRVAMAGVVEKMKPYLAEAFAGRFNPLDDVIRMPVPPDQQVEIKIPGGRPDTYRGPSDEVIGFLIHDLTEDDYLRVAVRVMSVARQLLDAGDPADDRSTPGFHALRAQTEVNRIVAARQQVVTATQAREAVRRRVGKALGLHFDQATGNYNGDPDWARESREFTYAIKPDGTFIDRLQPYVDRLNTEMEQSGFTPPPILGRSGVYFDPDIKEVDAVLPRPILNQFLDEVDRIEHRLAKDNVISIEAVRLTDSEIINGAIASRLNAEVQGVHNVNRGSNRAIMNEASINSLTAVANYQLQLSHFGGVQSGALPAGTTPLTFADLNLQAAPVPRTSTTIGSDFSIGADDIFFDGRQQSYGFSYIGPDGHHHSLSIDVVDSLREFWDRIERNLIVHKIHKTDTLVDYTVPVGPKEKSFKGIAAIISQSNQDVVVSTGTGAIEKLEASAGTWLVVQDFAILPMPGASTQLNEEEQRSLELRVLLTMFLRDPNQRIDNGTTIDKAKLVDLSDRDKLDDLLHRIYSQRRDQPIRHTINAPSYREVFERRFHETLNDAGIEKRERNSRITLTFYSSQGDIIQQPGLATTLGDQNDLTSFTTELRPNVVTPISSFLTKNVAGAKGFSPLTGVSKGESAEEEKNMTHLVIRARFPTVEREKFDRAEGRFLGYFQLPSGRQPHSQVDLPFLSSSEHPLHRLANLRVGMLFPALQRDKVRDPLALINPNQLLGSVSFNVWETATTRMLHMRKIISDSLNANQALAAEFDERFKVEVRNMLEYDEDFFDLPNIALRNTAQWNDPDRIIIALKNSTGKFALLRLLDIVENLGEQLVNEEYADRFLAVAERDFWGRHRIRPLSPDELKTLRRDVANHFLRISETYGDAFLEAVSALFSLGSYKATEAKEMRKGPFSGYLDLVVFDALEGQTADPELYAEALAEFGTLRNKPYKAPFGKRSLRFLEDLHEDYQRFVTRGRTILERADWWWFLYTYPR